VSADQYAKQLCACGCGQHPRGWKAAYVRGHRPLLPLADRLWAHVDRSGDGCWEWTRYIKPEGYGQIGYRRAVKVGRGHKSNASELAEEFGITKQYVAELVSMKWRKAA
jgi:hypothetical protein